MKTMTSVISALLLIGSIISLESCDLFEKGQKPKTELEKLPPETQEGKNTFGCLVDGKAWLTRTSIDAQAFYQEGVLSITADLSEKAQGISITIRDSDIKTIEYVLESEPIAYALFGDDVENCGYSTTSMFKGKLLIKKIDKVNFIISGIFEFEAYSAACDKIVLITNGRFDLNYAP